MPEARCNSCSFKFPCALIACFSNVLQFSPRVRKSRNECVIFILYLWHWCEMSFLLFQTFNWPNQPSKEVRLNVRISLQVNLAPLTLSLPSSRSTFSQPFQEKCISEVVRIGVIIICHLSKLWKNKFSILYDGIFLVRLQEKFEIDHSWEWKG